MKIFRENRLVYMDDPDKKNSNINLDDEFFLGGLEEASSPEDGSLEERTDQITQIYNEALIRKFEGENFQDSLDKQLSLLPASHQKLKERIPILSKELNDEKEKLKTFLEKYNLSQDVIDNVEYVSLYTSQEINLSPKLEKFLQEESSLSDTELQEILDHVKTARPLLYNKRLEIQNLVEQVKAGIELQFQAREIENLKRQALLKISSLSGINLTDHSTWESKDIKFSYLDADGIYQTRSIKLKDLFVSPTNSNPDIENPTSNTYQVYFSLVLPDLQTGEPIETDLSLDQLEGFLQNGLALDFSIQSADSLKKSLDWDVYGFDIKPQELNYLENQNYTAINITEVNHQRQEITLDKEVKVNGVSKNILGFAEFSKWALQAKAAPTISEEDFQSSLSNIATDIESDFGAPEGTIILDIQPGSKVTSILTGQEVEIIGFVDGKNLAYQTSGKRIEKPLGQALQYLHQIKACSEIKNTPQPTNPQEDSDSDDTPPDGEGGGEVPPGSPPEAGKKDNEEKKDKVTDTSYKAVNSEWDIRDLNPIALGHKAVTANGNLYWLNIAEIVALTTESFKDIKETIKTEADYKFHTMAEKWPFASGAFKNLRKATKGTKIEGHTKILEQLSPNQQLGRLYATTDFFEFYAALKQLEEKGLIPMRDDRFISRLNYFVDDLGLPQSYKVNPLGENDRYEQRDTAIKSLLDAILDPPTGTNMIRSNESNYNSAVSKFQAEMNDIIQDDGNGGMVLLHNALVDYKNSPDSSVTAPQVQGYILAALDEGIDYEDIVPYIIHARYIQNKSGVELLSKDFIGAVKKKWAFLNFFMEGNDDELKHLMNNGCALDLSTKKSSDKDSEKEPEGRFINYEASKSAVHWIISSKSNNKKTKSYLDEHINEKDYAAANLAIVPYDDLAQRVVPPGNLSCNVKVDTIINFQKQIPGFFASHCEVATDPQAQKIREGKYIDHISATKSAISNWYLIYSSSHDTAYKTVQTKRKLSEEDQKGLAEHNGKMKAFLSMLLAESGKSETEIINHLYASFEQVVDDDYRNKDKFVVANENLHKYIKAIDPSTFEKVMQRAHKEGIFTDENAWKAYDKPIAPMPIGYVPKEPKK